MRHETAKLNNILLRITIGLAMTMIIGGLATLDALASAKTQDVEADVVFRSGFIYSVDTFH